MRSAIRWLHWVPLIYSIVALASAFLLRQRLPLPIERMLAIVVAPLVIIYYPLYPLLKPLGMVEGEWLAGPTPLGIVFGALVYGAVLWGAVRLLLLRH